MGNKKNIEKIMKYGGRILKYTKGMTYDDFAVDDMVIDACVFNLGQMGEEANGVDEDFEKEHPDVPWRELYGLRNRVFHDYEGVNISLVWQIIQNDLEPLLITLQELLDAM